MHHTRMKQKINQLDGKRDCNVDESNSAKNLCPDDSKSENFIKTIKCEHCENTTKEELQLVKHSAKLHNQCVKCVLTVQVQSYIKRKTTVINLSTPFGTGNTSTWPHKICVWTGLLYGVTKKMRIFSSPNRPLCQFGLLVTKSVFVSVCDIAEGSG